MSQNAHSVTVTHSRGIWWCRLVFQLSVLSRPSLNLLGSVAPAHILALSATQSLRIGELIERRGRLETRTTVPPLATALFKQGGCFFSRVQPLSSPLVLNGAASHSLVKSSTPDTTNANHNHNVNTNLDPKDANIQDNLSRTLLFQASILQSSLGDHVQSLNLYTSFGPPGLPYSDSVELQLQLAERLMVLGQVRNEAGKHKGAAEVLAEAVDVCRGAVAADAGAGVDEGAEGGLKVKMKVDKLTATRIKEKSLARALNSYAWYVFEGDHSDATTPAYAQGLEAAEESVRILRRLLPGLDARTRNDICTTVSLDDEKERLDLQIALLNSMDTLMRCYNFYSRCADTLVLASEGHTLLRSLHTSLLREDVHPEEKEAYGSWATIPVVA
ncbi:hypothetical protein FA15DRAFT_660144 [Coprinopsis marcescibilis]|uniref:Uncharacterized protein n=1 Tax=Coprinopsis marcescibilis TaxID=230819 RepID=A0A5C3KH02_COPMA|nr:hypothetical protein FA15DRAFT_660144 [Coprinopsis marcescibilis]